MPVYEYRCKSCGETHEITHGYNDERPTKCPTCGGQLIRVFHPIGVVFKGSGFHKTDYGKSGVRAASSESQGAGGEGKTAETKPSDSKSGEGKSGEVSSTKEKSGESKSGEGKPAAAKSSESKPASDPKQAKAP
ncbi:MAG TPA: FmdB family zinc ribbon protein [Candidatus Eremiobacteraceae bacterium]|nr:FmdB family zinc ribbon protein [Candidatus Eremiobacteraceae bacterium]